MIRLYVEADLAPASSIELAPGQSHYLSTVMRRQPGDVVAVFNGREGEWRATVRADGRRGCRLEIKDQIRPQVPEPGPTLLFAPLKRSRMEVLIEKGTELGVAAFAPVMTVRTVVDRVNPGRLRATAIEAAEQCGRLTIPDLHPLRSLAAALERPVLLADETGTGTPLLAALRDGARGDLLVGPEGGFDPAELGALRARPEVTFVDLGPRTLRAETAAIAAVVLWQAAAGVGGTTLQATP